MNVQPKYKQIYDVLTGEIAEGMFAAGEKLPTECALAGRFGVTRQTVLKALDAMKHDGVITSERGRGTFVAVTQGRRSAGSDSERRIYFIASNLEDSFAHRVLIGVERASHRTGYSLVMCNTRNDPEREAESLRRARNTGAQGILLLPYLRRPNQALVGRVAAEIPLVFLDNALPGVNAPLVASDHYRSMYDAVSALLEMGHRRIGFILTMLEYLDHPGSIRDRYRAYRQALADGGVPFREEWVVELGQTLADSRPRDVGLDLYGYPAMHRMMHCGEVPTAVVLLWDELAPGALAAIRDGKKRVPEDFSLIGFNDDELCVYLSPKLSSVRQPAEEIGEKGFELLSGMIAAGKTESEGAILPCRLMIRESVRSMQGENIEK